MTLTYYWRMKRGTLGRTSVALPTVAPADTRKLIALWNAQFHGTWMYTTNVWRYRWWQLQHKWRRYVRIVLEFSRGPVLGAGRLRRQRQRASTQT